MKVLITGAGGQVASALINEVPHGYSVRAVTHRELDITDVAVVAQQLDSFVPSVIVNCAAYTAVDRAEHESGVAETVNVNGAAVLANAASNLGSRLIHLSTDYVFDGNASRPYLPEAMTHPLSVYGRTKRDGELAALQGCADTVVLRTSWVYSRTGSNFLTRMIELMNSRPEIRVVADQIGSPTWAGSVARAIWACIEHPKLRGIMHFADCGVATWYDFAVAIAEEAQVRGLVQKPSRIVPIYTHEYPTAARRPAYSVLDSGETREALGLAPTHWRSQLRAALGD